MSTLLTFLNEHFDAPWQPIAQPPDQWLPVDAYNFPEQSAYLQLGSVRLYVGENPTENGRPNWYCVGARGIVEFDRSDKIVSEIPKVVARIALDHLRHDPQEFMPSIPVWSVDAWEKLRAQRIVEADHDLAQYKRKFDRTTKEREVLVFLERIRPTLPPSKE
jgi:hypothetical protein